MIFPSKRKYQEQQQLIQDLQTKVQALETTPKDTAYVICNAAFDVDKDLAPTPDAPVNTPQQAKLSYNPTFGGVSVEDAMSTGSAGGIYKYWDYYKSTSVLRKCINLIASLSTRAGFETTIRCLDDKDDPKKPEYIEVKKKIDTLNHRVNMDNVLYVTQVKRHLYGNSGWQIVQGSNTEQIMEVRPLNSGYIYPRLDENGVFKGLEYSPATTGFIPKEFVLYFNLDDLEHTEPDMLGVSSIRSIEREIKIKKNLQRDLLYAARSLWAPIVIYNADTRGLTPPEREALFEDLKKDLKPGGVVVTNRAVNATVVQYHPDLNNLIRAIQMQDEDIIGNYGIPKALLSREKTIARATLEFSIKAFFESTICQEQIYLKRQLEKQWYDPLVESLGFADKIMIKHEWKPILDPASELITALVRAYESGVIGGEEFFRRLGWDLDKIPEDAEEKPREEAGEAPPPKVTKVNKE
jgi:hypothetical protein